MADNDDRTSAEESGADSAPLDAFVESGTREKDFLVSAFHSKYRWSNSVPRTWKQTLTTKCSSIKSKTWWAKVVKRNFPFIRILGGYSLKQDFPSDLVSGLTVGIMQIPQSMAYAMLASLPPICGLYTALFAPIIYFFLGSSRHISMGIIAIVSLMIGTVLDREVGSEDELTAGNFTTLNSSTTSNSFSPTEIKKIQVATALSFVSGLFMVLFGKIGLGVVTSYMSEPLVSGFTTGAATQVITSQVKHVFGIKVQRFNGAFKVIKTWIAFFGSISETNFAALIMSLICMVLLYLVKIQVNQRFKSRLRVPIPIELVVVILGTVASHFGEFNEKYDLNIVEDIPAGLPSPQLPDIQLAKNFLFDAIIIGIVAFAQSVSMAKIFAKKNGYKIDSNQEMVGYGAGSVFASFFSGYITAASVARSSVQESAGGKTQIASLFSCGIVMVVVMAVGPLFYNLPTCVLAAVIIVSLRSLFLQVFDLRTLWRVSTYDFAIWIVTFAGVVILDADYGLGIGILFSLLTVVVRMQRTKVQKIGEIDSTEVFRPIQDYTEVHTQKGVAILTYNSSIYFANADKFVQSVQKSLQIDPQKAKKRRQAEETSSENAVQMKDGNVEIVSADFDSSRKKLADGSDKSKIAVRGHPLHDIHHVVVDCSGINFVDTMGVKALKEVIQDFQAIDIDVFLALCKDEVVDVFKNTDFWGKHSERVFVTLRGAVMCATDTQP